MVREGWVEKGERPPVNPFGSLKSKWHLIGVTSVSMHAMVALQIIGEALDGIPIPNARPVWVFNMDGAAVANSVLSLERLNEFERIPCPQGRCCPSFAARHESRTCLAASRPPFPR